MRRILYIITGTTKGIGKALVSEALKEKTDGVISFSRSAPSISTRHQNIEVDLNRHEDIPRAFDRIDPTMAVDAFSNVVLINNAGVLAPIAPVELCKDNQLIENISINLIAPLLLIKHFLLHFNAMAAKKLIINLSSGAARTPYYGWSAYCAAKAGMDMVTKTVADEIRRFHEHVSIVAIAPGTVDTQMQTLIRNSTKAKFSQIDKFLALKKNNLLLAPETVAKKIIALIKAEQLENGERYDLRGVGTDVKPVKSLP